MKYKLGLYINEYEFKKKRVKEVIEGDYYSYLIVEAIQKIKNGYFQGIILKENKLFKRISKDGVVYTYLSKNESDVVRDILWYLCEDLYLSSNERIKIYTVAGKLVIKKNKRKLYIELNNKLNNRLTLLTNTLRELCNDRGIYYISFKPSDIIKGGNLLIDWVEEENSCVGVTIRRVVNGRVV